MHSFVTYTLLASASMVAALDPRFEFPDTVPALLKRQAPGTPQYACHEDCGMLHRHTCLHVIVSNNLPQVS